MNFKIKQIVIACCCAVLMLQANASSIEYNIAKGLPPIAKDQSIAVLKPFQGEFRILGTKGYQLDEQAKFSPVDFAVSWGYMAAPDIAKQIQVRQYDRYLNWQIKKLPIAPEQAIQMVSNMHIIPASPDIAVQIQRVKPGDFVRLKGELVEIKDKNLVWRSSLSNTDVGDGACELFRVKSVQWLEKSRG